MHEKPVIFLGHLDHGEKIKVYEHAFLSSDGVEVTTTPFANARQDEGALQYLQRIRGKEAAAHKFPTTKEEIDAEIEKVRDRGEDRSDEVRSDEILP